MKRKPADPEGSPPELTKMEQLIEAVQVAEMFSPLPGHQAPPGSPAVRVLKAMAVKVSAAQSVKGRKPRKPVTKAELERFRDEYLVGRLRVRGWQKIACLHFGITDKTLKKRMTE
jgi:hypothetical protein